MKGYFGDRAADYFDLYDNVSIHKKNIRFLSFKRFYNKLQKNIIRFRLGTKLLYSLIHNLFKKKRIEQQAHCINTFSLIDNSKNIASLLICIICSRFLFKHQNCLSAIYHTCSFHSRAKIMSYMSQRIYNIVFF